MTEAEPRKKVKRTTRKKKKATRSGKPDPEAAGEPAPAERAETTDAPAATRDNPETAAAQPEPAAAPARRKRSRGGRGRGRKTAESAKAEAAEPAEAPASAPAPTDWRDETDDEPTLAPDAEPEAEAETEAKPARARRKRGGRSTRKRETAAADPADEAAPRATPAKTGARLMVINVAEQDECRIAILHNNRLEELFMERLSAESHVGNIYKGRVINVEPSIQAAFVDFGLPKHGFLHISDLQPQYFPDGRSGPEEVGRKTPHRDRPPIQKCLRRGQEVIVQITKEGIGTKGPTLTTYISIPGRYLVMMPGMSRLGVSRKIEDLETRRSMRDVLGELDLPKGMGFILRTAGLDQNRRELQRDLNYLQRLWKVVASRIKSEPSPCELYQESDLVIRTIRDVYSSDFSGVVVDEEATAKKVRDFLAIAAPRATNAVEFYDAGAPLFHRYGIEQEIEKLHSRHVPLASGGSLVIDSTEAIVAIDVNSGKYRKADDPEAMAYKINCEAAAEIARQLRLRDLGGLLICDFIDMRHDRHCRGVEKILRDALKDHKARAKILRMSQFGVIEITRQRTRPSIKRSIYQDCPHCKGSGLVKTTESMSLDVTRLLRVAGTREAIKSIDIRVAPDVSFHLQNRCRTLLYEFEKETGRSVIVTPESGFAVDQVEFVCRDHRGGTVPFDPGGSRR